MTATVEVIKDPFFSFNGVDLSDQCGEVALNFSLDELESTASGDDSHVSVPGLEKPSGTVKLFRNYGAGSVEATLWAAKGTIVPVIIRRKRAVKAVDNPEFTFNAFVSQQPVIGGAVGALDECQVSLAFNTKITRATA